MATLTQHRHEDDGDQRRDPTRTACSPGTRSITQYGVQTPNTTAVLVVTNDLPVAQRSLRWIEGGHIVTRTVIEGDWLPARP